MLLAGGSLYLEVRFNATIRVRNGENLSKPLWNTNKVPDEGSSVTLHTKIRELPDTRLTIEPARRFIECRCGTRVAETHARRLDGGIVKRSHSRVEVIGS